jgi:hypothetical protein
MYTKFVKIALLFGGLLALAMSMSAESVVVNVQVPFAFMAGGKLMPAGTYAIDETGRSGVLIIRGNAPGSAAAMLVLSSGTSLANHAGVSFTRHGSEVILTGVQIPGGLNYTLIQPEVRR